MGSGISVHSTRGVAPGVSDSSGSLPRRMATSSRVEEVQWSSPAGSKSEASTISSPLKCIKGGIHLWNSLLNHIELWSASLSFLCRSAVHRPRPGSSSAWKSLVWEALLWGMKSWGHGLLSQGGHPTNPRPHVGIVAACMPPPAIRHSARPPHQCSTPSQWVFPWNPTTSSDFLPPVGMVSGPFHLHQDPSAGVVHWIQFPFWS